jgi:hypothetical protein
MKLLNVYGLVAIAVAGAALCLLSGCSGKGSTTPTPSSQFYDPGKEAQEKAAADHLSAIQARNIAIAMAHMPKGYTIGGPPAGYKRPVANK